MNKVEKEAERKEAESLLAYQALIEHEGTRKSMMREFEAADKKCIDVARQLVVLDAAGSPQVTPLKMELRSLRVIRHGIDWSWNRSRDLLAAALEKTTVPEIFRFHQWVVATARGLQDRINTEYDDSRQTVGGERRVSCRSNARPIAEAIAELFAGLKAVQALRLKPLLEVHSRINEVVARYEDFALDIPMQSRDNILESELRRLQSISSDLKRKNEAVSYRGGIRYTT
jgi:hypothetical protein